LEPISRASFRLQEAKSVGMHLSHGKPVPAESASFGFEKTSVFRFVEQASGLALFSRKGVRHACSSRVHAHRTTGGHFHHCHTDWSAVARRAEGTRGGQSS